MNHFDEFCTFVKKQPLSEELKDGLIRRLNMAMQDAYERGSKNALATHTCHPDDTLTRRKLERLEKLFLAVSWLTLHHDVLGECAVVFPSKLGDALKAVNPDWYKNPKITHAPAKKAIVAAVRPKKSLSKLTVKERHQIRLIKNNKENGGLIPAVIRVRELTTADLVSAKRYVETL